MPATLRSLVFALTVAGCCSAQANVDALLSKTRAAMQQRLSNTPDYACVLELDRLTFPPNSRTAFYTKELARLEVAVVDGHELFGWPGEASTEETLDALLGPGLSSTGEFSMHGRATFLDDRSVIERLPAERQTRPGLVGYAYSVPLDASRYVIASATGGLQIPYQGEFWADAESGQLAQLDVRVPAAPAQSGLRSVRSEVAYSQTQVGGRPAWLPSQARIDVEAVSGELLRNDLRFTGCRAFQAESTIRFDDGPASAASDNAQERELQIPKGLILPIELTATLDSAKVRAGDRFEATLLREARVKGEAILPQGATVVGRVRQVLIPERSWFDANHRPHRMASLTLELLEAHIAGRCGRLSATLEMVESIPLMGRADPSGRADVPRGLATSNLAVAYETSRKMSAPRFGTFNVSKDMFLIRPGAKMRWRTEEPPPGGCAP